MNRYARALRHRMIDADSDIATHLPILIDRAVQLEARTIVELGSRAGNSTTAWLYALEELGSGTLTTVDLDPAPRLRAPSSMVTWRHHQADDLASWVLHRVPARIDLLFIDTSHEYQRTLDELRAYGCRVRPGGLIVLHDVDMAQPGWPYEDGEPYPVRTAAMQWQHETRAGARWVEHVWSYGLGLLEIGA